MAYNNAIPAANDQLSQSQLDILNNFIEIQNAFNTDHVVFNDPSQGKHAKVRMPVQGAPPALTVGEGALWNQLYAKTGKNEAHIRKQNQAGDVSIPFTASVLSDTAAPANLSAGWTYLPSGIILKWGGIPSTPGGITTDLNVALPGPALSAILTVQVTPARPSADTLISIGVSFPNVTVYSTGNINSPLFVVGY